MYKDLGNNVLISSPTVGTVIVTKPTIFGGVAHHCITSEYSMDEIALWIMYRQRMVQDAFPTMKKEDREFLLTGITPHKWRELFPPEEETDE